MRRLGELLATRFRQALETNREDQGDFIDLAKLVHKPFDQEAAAHLRGRKSGLASDLRMFRRLVCAL